MCGRKSFTRWRVTCVNRSIFWWHWFESDDVLSSSFVEMFIVLNLCRTDLVGLFWHVHNTWICLLGIWNWNRLNLGFELNKFLHVTRVFVCAMDWDGILCDVNGYGIVMLFGKILFLAFLASLSLPVLSSLVFWLVLLIMKTKGGKLEGRWMMFEKLWHVVS